MRIFFLFLLLVVVTLATIVGQVLEVNKNTELRARIQQMEIERANLNACQGDMRP